MVAVVMSVARAVIRVAVGAGLSGEQDGAYPGNRLRMRALEQGGRSLMAILAGH